MVTGHGRGLLGQHRAAGGEACPQPAKRVDRVGEVGEHVTRVGHVDGRRQAGQVTHVEAPHVGGAGGGVGHIREAAARHGHMGG